MNLSNIVIVLDHPDESRNIGAACRAMANNDISDLRIVGNKADYDIEHIHVLAIHAGPIFDYAHLKDSYIDILTESVFVPLNKIDSERGYRRGRRY